jgi:hypothetical protein
MIMDAPERGALMLVRFIAAALIGWAMVDSALYYAIARHNNTALAALPFILKSIPAVIGLIVLIKAKAIAEWVADMME